MANPNIVSRPPISIPVLDSLGRTSPPWSAFFRDIYNRTSNKSGNAIDDASEVVTDHINDVTIHFTEASIDHKNIQNIGIYTHDEIDEHIDDDDVHPWLRDSSTGITVPKDYTDIVEWKDFRYNDTTTGVTNSLLVGENIGVGGNLCTFIGNNIAQSSTSGSISNNAHGFEALRDLLGGSNNNAFGNYSLAKVTSGQDNIGIGGQAAEDLTTGSDNIAIGALTLDFMTGGQQNVTVGNNSGNLGFTGSYNTIVGDHAGIIGQGDYNTGIGYYSLYQNGGDYNAALGHRSGYNHQGDRNVYIGPFSGEGESNANDMLYIGNNNTTTLIKGDFANKILTFDCAVDQSLLTAQPTGGVDLAIATTKYVNDNDFWTRTGTLLNPETSGDDVEWDAFKYLDATTGGAGNFFIGPDTGASNAANNNTGLGDGALFSNVTGANNIAIGQNSLSGGSNISLSIGIGSLTLNENNSTKSTAIGYQAARYNQGQQGTFVGYMAGSGVSGATGYKDVGIGADCLLNLRNGYHNTAVGTGAGQSITNESGCVFIGYQAGGNHTGAWNRLYIANSNTSTPLIYGEFSNPYVKVAGGFGAGYVAKTANYTATRANYTIDCTANSFTVTLPTAVGYTGQIYNIKNSGSGVITVATTSSQTIDGSTTKTIGSTNTNVQVQSTGANWIIL